MSKAIAEVVLIDAIKPHPNADRLEIAVIKGWDTVVQKDTLKVGQKVVYIPYDTIIPPELAHGPTDTPPGRLNVAKYCAVLPKDEQGNRSIGYRVRAARLRQYQSYGIIMPLDQSKGDDESWPVGTDVSQHYGITKWVPPEPSEDGDAEKDHPRFHVYTEIERIQNYPGVIKDGEEVVFTEKIHGKCNRLGLVLADKNPNGNPMEPPEGVWTPMAGSHEVRRKEFSVKTRRFDLWELEESKFITGVDDVSIGMIFETTENLWRVDEFRHTDSPYCKCDECKEGFVRLRRAYKVFRRMWESARYYFNPEGKPRRDYRLLIKATQVSRETREPIQYQSDYWKFMKPAREVLEFIKNEYQHTEPMNSIIIYGEYFGSGVQDLTYGLKDGLKGFRVFDICINGRYLDYDVKVAICKTVKDKYGTFLELVPLVYRGPFSTEIVKKHTDGKTLMCDPSKAGEFKGREGIIITPVHERYDFEVGRVIFKSVSVDYIGRKGAIDNR